MDIKLRVKSLEKRSRTVLLFADHWNRVAEENENNNKKSLFDTFNQRTDLKVEYCGDQYTRTCYPNSGNKFYQGFSNTIKWKLTNPGSFESQQIKLRFRTPLSYLNDIEFSNHPGHGFTCTHNRTYGTGECTGGSMGGSKPTELWVYLRVTAKTLISTANFASDLTPEIDLDDTIRNEASESNNAVTQRAWILGRQ